MKRLVRQNLKTRRFLIHGHFDLTPQGIIDHHNLLRPIYRQTASYGHYGRPDFPWERTDKVAELRKAVNGSNLKDGICLS